jgi:hypothetical protein
MNDGGAFLIAPADDLKEQIGTGFVDGQVTQFVEHQHGGSQELLSSALRRYWAWAAVKEELLVVFGGLRTQAQEAMEQLLVVCFFRCASKGWAWLS